MHNPAFQLAESVNELASPGLLGFLAIAFVAGALFFLMRSMKRRLDGVRSGDFDQRVAATPHDSETAKDE